MTKKKSKWMYLPIWGRRILYLVIAALLMVLTETALHIPKFTRTYSAQSMAGELQEKKGKLVYEKIFSEPRFIGKIEIRGTFYKNIDYTVKIESQNEFGAAEEKTIKDRANQAFGQAYTPIDQNVKKIHIIFGDKQQVTLEDVLMSNELEVLPERLALFFIIFFFAQMILFERKILVRHLEWVFLVSALSFGMLLIAIAGPRMMSWDESIHYQRAYSLMKGAGTVEWNESEYIAAHKSFPKVNTIEECELLKAYVNDKAAEVGESTKSAGFQKNMLIYFPMSLFYEIGEKLNLPFTWAFGLGRLGNLLVCALLGFLAIRTTREKKILTAGILLMPTVLFQSSMYSYDGLIIFMITLGCIIWFREISREAAKPLNCIVTAALFMISCMAKPAYFPIFLLLLPLVKKFMPKNLHGKKARKIYLSLGLLAILICAVILSNFAIPLLKNLAAGNLSYGGDSRGGDTGAVAQILSILKHPAAFLKMLFGEIFNLENFRNPVDASGSKYFVLNQMFLNFYLQGSLKNSWLFVLFPMLFMLFLVNPAGEEKPRNCYKVWNAFVIGGSISLIWLALYLSFTPIGQSSVDGVQARYYLPLLMPLAYVLWNNRISIRISKERYYQIILGGNLLLMGNCIYSLLLASIR